MGKIISLNEVLALIRQEIKTVEEVYSENQIKPDDLDYRAIVKLKLEQPGNFVRYKACLKADADNGRKSDRAMGRLGILVATIAMLITFNTTISKDASIIELIADTLIVGAIGVLIVCLLFSAVSIEDAKEFSKDIFRDNYHKKLKEKKYYLYLMDDIDNMSIDQLKSIFNNE